MSFKDRTLFLSVGFVQVLMEIGSVQSNRNTTHFEAIRRLYAFIQAFEKYHSQIIYAVHMVSMGMSKYYTI